MHNATRGQTRIFTGIVQQRDIVCEEEFGNFIQGIIEKDPFQVS